MIGIDKLEALAKGAIARGEEIGEESWYSQEEFVCNMLMHSDDATFAEATAPQAILALIAEVRHLRSELNDFTAQCGGLNEEVVRLRERGDELACLSALLADSVLSYPDFDDGVPENAKPLHDIAMRTMKLTNLFIDAARGAK